MSRPETPAGMPLEAGYGERIITPPLGTELAGYGFYLERRAERVLDDLEARCLFLRLGETTLILVSCDLIGFSIDAADAHRRRIAARWNVPPEHVLLACTHTHSGPATKPAIGLGEMDPAYTARLPAWIDDAVEGAAADLRACDVCTAEENVEAIGYNRRGPGADAVDSALRVAVFERPERSIYLANFACHPVTVGRTGGITADWPGALAAALARDGHRAMVLQGCCGDVDPVTSLREDGHGSHQDAQGTGGLLARLAQAAVRREPTRGVDRIAAIERRIRLPLTVWDGARISHEAQAFVDRFGQFPGATRFADEWKRRALEARAGCAVRPFIDDVPIQAIRIGDLRLVALPGEPFTRLGARIRAAVPSAWVVGYANGSVGYLPTRDAFGDLSDYACYCAPRFVTLFPFDEGLEDLFVRESLALLSAV